MYNLLPEFEKELETRSAAEWPGVTHLKY